jgi:hypothetical protein
VTKDQQLHHLISALPVQVNALPAARDSALPAVLAVDPEVHASVVLSSAEKYAVSAQKKIL